MFPICVWAVKNITAIIMVQIFWWEYFFIVKVKNMLQISLICLQNIKLHFKDTEILLKNCKCRVIFIFKISSTCFNYYFLKNLSPLVGIVQIMEQDNLLWMQNCASFSIARLQLLNILIYIYTGPNMGDNSSLTLQ